MKLLGGRLRIPGIHVYPPGHTRNQEGRGTEVHLFGRPPARPTAAGTEAPRRTAQLPPDRALPLVGNTPLATHSRAEDFNDFESIRSLMFEPQADPQNALRPGEVVQLTETHPADSSLEIGLLQRLQDPKVTKVMVHEIKTIDVAPGEPKTLFTFGLGGCIAVSILSRKQDGTISATLSHRPPEELDDQLREIDHELGCHPHGGLGIGREILILAPGGYKETGSHRELQPAVTAELAQLVRMLDARLPGITPTVVSYHPRRPNEQSDALVIDFPAEAGDPVRYQGIHNAPSGL